MLIHGDGSFTRLSKDHKPNNPKEVERIEKAGGFVRVLDAPRVDGALALSRAFGDSVGFVTQEALSEGVLLVHTGSGVTLI